MQPLYSKLLDRKVLILVYNFFSNYSREISLFERTFVISHCIKWFCFHFCNSTDMAKFVQIMQINLLIQDYSWLCDFLIIKNLKCFETSITRCYSTIILFSLRRFLIKKVHFKIVYLISFPSDYNTFVVHFVSNT